MEIFYSNDIRGDVCFLDQEESGHCVRVLRHRSGDHICVIDGEGTFYDCTLLDDSPKAASARIDGRFSSISTVSPNHPGSVTTCEVLNDVVFVIAFTAFIEPHKRNPDKPHRNRPPHRQALR